MDDLFALVAAIFEALGARNRPAGRPGRLGASLREALGERVAAPAPRPPTLAPRPPTLAARPPTLAPRPPAPASTTTVALPQTPGPVEVAAAPGGLAIPRRPAPAGQRAEAGRVTALFANPQSLVAAFIVAEVLAKPVALRDSQGGLTPFVR
jgi:hypothetical protein